MPSVESNGVELYYETDGNGPPLLLIMGLAGQLIDWPDGLVERLAQDFTVVRYDNRDVGLSTWLDHEGRPGRLDVIRANLFKSTTSLPYSLADMAADAVGLLDALGIDKADVVGTSMGGMIAQLVALNHSARVRTLCSIMSTTGNVRVGRPSVRVLLELSRRAGVTDKDEAVESVMRLFRLVGGADWDETEQRRRAEISLARGYNPDGAVRQTVAIAGTGDRTERLRKLQIPTVVIHGLADQMVAPSGGIATAKAIPDSRLVMFPRMGHDMPASRHDEIAAAIVANARRSVPAVAEA